MIATGRCRGGRRRQGSEPEPDPQGVRHADEKLKMPPDIRLTDEQFSAQSTETRLSVDPQNRPLWRHAPRRRNAEEFRDGMLAAAGVKTGYSYGATDEFGTHAVEGRMHTTVHATRPAPMGLDHEQLTYNYAGRDFRLTDVACHVVREIFAERERRTTRPSLGRSPGEEEWW